MKYEDFLKKMMAMKMIEIPQHILTKLKHQFFLYNFVNWEEISLTVEALYNGLTSMHVSPKDARIKCTKLFIEIFPYRIDEGIRGFLAHVEGEQKLDEEFINSLMTARTIHCAHNFSSLNELLKFTKEKATEFSMENTKENFRFMEEGILSNLVDDVYVVRDPSGFLEQLGEGNLSTKLMEHEALKKRVELLENELIVLRGI